MPVAVVATLDQSWCQINEIEHTFERDCRIGVREQSLDRGTKRRQIAGKSRHSLIVDQACAALQPFYFGIDRRSGRIGAISSCHCDPQGAHQRSVVQGRIEQQRRQPIGAQFRQNFGGQKFRFSHRQSDVQLMIIAKCSSAGQHRQRANALA